MRFAPPLGRIDDARLETLESRLLLSAAAGADGAQAPLAATADLTQIAESAWDLIDPVTEAESQGGESNDDMATAQPLSFTYLLPTVSPDDGLGPQHASVVGVADGVGGAGQAYLDFTMVFGAVSSPNVYALDFIDAIAPGGDGVLRISAKADLAGAEKYLMVEAEGVNLGHIFVDDVASGTTVTAEIVLPREQLAAWVADGTVNVTVTPSAAVCTVSGSWMSAELSYSGPGGAGAADYYSVDLAAGESLSLGLVDTGGGPLELQLVAADGTVLAEGATGYDNFRAAIDRYAAGQAETVYVRLSGEGEYQLVANRNATLDLENNDSFATAQTIDTARVSGRQWVIGQLAGEGHDGDVYAVTLDSRAVVSLQTWAPGGGGGPTIHLYDAAGDRVATTAAGRRAALRYKVPGGGEYFIEVTGESTGGYILGMGGRPTSSGRPWTDRPGQRPAKEGRIDRPTLRQTAGVPVAPEVLRRLGRPPAKARATAARRALSILRDGVRQARNVAQGLKGIRSDGVADRIVRVV